MPKPNLLSSKRYKTFVADRDKALEAMHQHAQLDVSRVLFEGLEQVSGFVSKMAIQDQLTIYNLNSLSGQLETFTGHIFGLLFPVIVHRWMRFRQATWTLTYTGEAEAIGRATQRSQLKPKLGKPEKHWNGPTLNGQIVEQRVWLALMKLRSKIVNAFNLALVQELPHRQILEKLKQSFPKIESFKRPPRELKPLREANKIDDDDEKKELLEFDFIEDGDWDLAVQAYKDTELPPSRFDQSPEIDPEAGYYRYNWELEQDLADDFVKQVREGQVDAANDLGIKDFVWVAILDDKTDDCCADRNGHTTQEIEDMLDSGELDEDECDATSPPAHNHCRCALAPIDNVDEVEGPDWKSFGDWLES